MTTKRYPLKAGDVLISLLRRVRGSFLLTLAITGLAIGATLLYADPTRNQPEFILHNSPVGTWLSHAEPGAPPQLFSFMIDGRLIFSRSITVPTGPTSVDLVGTGHGEWIQTGHREFTSTMFLIRSSPTQQFTGLVKVTSSFTLNRDGDQLASSGTVYIYDADNHLLLSFPTPGSGVYDRVTAGQ